jgi:hypothetical protein
VTNSCVILISARALLQSSAMLSLENTSKLKTKKKKKKKRPKASPFNGRDQARGGSEELAGNENLLPSPQLKTHSSQGHKSGTTPPQPVRLGPAAEPPPAFCAPAAAMATGAPPRFVDRHGAPCARSKSVAPGLRRRPRRQLR